MKKIPFHFGKKTVIKYNLKKSVKIFLLKKTAFSYPIG